MTTESSGGNYFREEDDLEKWAEDMGQPYEPGSQGMNNQQPMTEWGSERRQALADRYRTTARGIDGLPVIPDEAERTLHRRPSELAAMTDSERLSWHLDAIDWAIANGSGVDNLIDPDPKLEDSRQDQ